MRFQHFQWGYRGTTRGTASLILALLITVLSACGKAADQLSSVPTEPTLSSTENDGPIIILGISKTADHQMQIQFQAPKARRIYQIQYITDLTQSNWIDISATDGGVLLSTHDAEVLTFTDSNATDPIRFYRVKLLGAI